MDNNKKNTIIALRLVIGLTLSIGLAFTIYHVLDNVFWEAKAQGQQSYLKMKVIKVLPNTNATVSVFCKKGNDLLSGGYSIGFTSSKSAIYTKIYSSHPAYQKNATGIFEGWESGLINNGNETVTIKSIALCLASL